MGVYEKDTGVIIPKWYLKLPQKTLNRISDLGIKFNRILTKKRNVDKVNKRNIEFYL